MIQLYCFGFTISQSLFQLPIIFSFDFHLLQLFSLLVKLFLVTIHHLSQFGFQLQHLFLFAYQLTLHVQFQLVHLFRLRHRHALHFYLKHLRISHSTFCLSLAFFQLVLHLHYLKIFLFHFFLQIQNFIFQFIQFVQQLNSLVLLFTLRVS